jgi:hypothetical protein
MDVHKDSIDIAVAEEAGEVRHHGRIGGDLNALSRAVRKLESLGRPLVFVYEAGPCGYGIYRMLKARGHECWVVSPSNTPRRVRDRIKTDRRDCLKLAGLARAGELEPTYVPDPANEAMRDLVRTREDAVAMQRQVLGQISSPAFDDATRPRTGLQRLAVHISPLAPRSLVRIVLGASDLVRPGALDVSEDRDDLVVAERAAEPRHIALVAGRSVLAGHEAMLGNAEKHRVGVMPGVAARVVRRRRHAAGRLLLAPVRLALEVRAVAARAVPVVQRPSGGDAGRVVARPRDQHGDRGDGNAHRGGARDERRSTELHSFTPRSRSAFPITDTDERLIAALAIIGLSSRPSQG